MAPLVQLVKPKADVLTQLVEPISLVQEAERVTDYLAGRGITPGRDAFSDHSFQFGVGETFIRNTWLHAFTSESMIAVFAKC